MYKVALKMLFGDVTKYLGLVFGVAFATLLITQQAGVFVNLMRRTTSVIRDAEQANIWVMDSSVQYIDQVYPMRDTELPKVRGISGVEWAVPFFKAQSSVRTPEGTLQVATILGVDDASLIGVPNRFLQGNLVALRAADAIAIDKGGYGLLWPGQPLTLGRTLELNDKRAVITAIVDASAPFTTSPIIYTRYTQALRYTNNGRNQMSFILARAASDLKPEIVAHDIADSTGLQVKTSSEFLWQTVGYYLKRTGIPINFGTVIILGLIVGVAVVGLTFNLFVSENIRQYAALKAIGLSNGKIVKMVLLQAAVVGVVGYCIGTGLAAAFFEFLPRKAPALGGFFLPWQIPALAAVLCTFIIIASTIASLRRVLVVDPAVVFRG